MEESAYLSSVHSPLAWASDGAAPSSLAPDKQDDKVPESTF